MKTGIRIQNISKKITKKIFNKEGLIKFRNFLKDFSTLRDRAFFHSLAHVSGKTDRNS